MTPRSLFLRPLLLVCALYCSASRSHAREPLSELAAVRAVCTTGSVAAWSQAKARLGAAQQSAASILPNPALQLEHQRSATGATEQETIVGLSLPLSVSGRRWLLQDVAQARGEQLRAEGRAALFESALQFRAAYATAVVERARAQILSQQQAHFDASSAVIEALQRKGEAAAYDLMRQRLQARVHRGSLEVAQARAAESLALLAAWTGQDVELPAIELVAFARAELTPAGGVQPQTPELQALRAAAQASALEARAARRRWVPDAELFAGYRALDTGAEVAHGVAAAITIPLTFFDHGQGEAARADAERALAEAAASRLIAERSAAEKAARARLEHLLHGFDATARLGDEAAELAVRAQQLYAAGESSITEMLDAFRAAEDARLALVERVREIALARLEVMRASGTMFDADLDRDCAPSQQRKQP